MPGEHGYAFEDSIANLCANSLLPDFLIQGHKVRFGKGKEEELADLVVPFGDTLLAFQTKSRLQPKPPDALDETDLGRIQKKIDRCVEQLKTTRRALEQNVIGVPENLRRHPVHFDWSGIKKIIGIVVIHLEGEEAFPLEQRTKIYNAYASAHGFPVHVLIDSDFAEVLKYNDTLGDLQHYFEVRYEMLSKNALVSFGPERDFLAVFKMRYDLIKRVLSGDKDIIALGADVGDRLFSCHKALEERDENLKLSYLLFDQMLDFLHTCLGYDIETKSYLTPVSSEEMADYYEIVTILGRSKRCERQCIAEAMHEKMRSALTRGVAYKCLEAVEGQPALLLCSYDREDRDDYLMEFQALSHAAYVQLEEKQWIKDGRLLAICTEPAGRRERSFSFVLLDRPQFTDEERAILQTPKLFGKMGRIQGDEWGNSRVVQ